MAGRIGRFVEELNGGSDRVQVRGRYFSPMSRVYPLDDCAHDFGRSEGLSDVNPIDLILHNIQEREPP